MSDRQGKLLAMMERKRNLMSEAPEDLGKQIFREIRDLDEKISEEEMELLERERASQRKCCKRGGVPKGESKDTDETVAVGGGLTRRTAVGSGSRGGAIEGGFLRCEVEGHPKDTEK